MSREPIKEKTRVVSIKLLLIYRRTPMSKCDFNKVAKLLYFMLHIFRTHFLCILLCIGMFRKVDLLVKSRNSGLLFTGCDVIQN